MQYDFGAQIRAIKNRTGIKLDTVVRKFCLDMFSDIMVASPVDTGAFRGNWQISLGTPNLSINDLSMAKSDAAALAKVSTEISGAVTNNVVAEGNTIYFTNSMPYAYRLEHGWSKQAPAGMVAVTVAAWQSHFNKALGV